MFPLEVIPAFETWLGCGRDGMPAYGSKGASININNDACGGLSKNSPHRLVCLNAWSMVSGPVREGLGGVTLEEVYHWGMWSLSFQKPTPGQVLHSLSLSLPVACGSDVSS